MAEAKTSGFDLRRSLRRWAYRSAVAPSTGRSPALAAPIIIFALAAAIPIVSGSAFQLSRYELILIYMLVAFGLNFSFGYAGQLNLGQPVLMGVAAYTAGLLSIDHGWNAWETLVPAVVVVMALGVVLNLPSFRLRGWYLAITTLFAVAVFPDILSATETWTGGDNGLGPISPIPGIGSRPVYVYEFILALVVVVWFAIRKLVYSYRGLRYQAMRDSVNAAQGAGLRTSSMVMTVTVLSSIPVALAGWVFAHTTEIISPNTFSFDLLLLIMASVILGGRGSLWGPVIGTTIFEVLSLYIGPFSSYNDVILGVGVLLSATIFPRGVVPLLREWVRGRLERVDPSLRPAGPLLAVSTGAAVPTGVAVSTGVAVPTAVEQTPAALATTSKPVLTVHGLTKSFGGRTVLRGVDLDLVGGRVYGLVGLNGSGKTTLLNVVTGYVSRDGGTVLIEGEPLANSRPYVIARRGVRRSFQVPQLSTELSVAQNIRLGALAPSRYLPHSDDGSGGGRRQALEARLVTVGQQLGLDAGDMSAPVGELSLGLRRIVEIGRAMIADPALICLDEPAAGLAAGDLARLDNTLRRLAEGGTTVLLIEHNLTFVHEVADVMIVLDDGNIEETRDLTAVGGLQRQKVPAGSPTTSTGPDDPNVR